MVKKLRSKTFIRADRNEPFHANREWRGGERRGKVEQARNRTSGVFVMLMYVTI